MVVTTATRNGCNSPLMTGTAPITAWPDQPAMATMPPMRFDISNGLVTATFLISGHMPITQSISSTCMFWPVDRMHSPTHSIHPPQFIQKRNPTSPPPVLFAPKPSTIDQSTKQRHLAQPKPHSRDDDIASRPERKRKRKWREQGQERVWTKSTSLPSIQQPRRRRIPRPFLFLLFSNLSIFFGKENHLDIQIPIAKHPPPTPMRNASIRTSQSQKQRGRRTTGPTRPGGSLGSTRRIPETWTLLGGTELRFRGLNVDGVLFIPFWGHAFVKRTFCLWSGESPDNAGLEVKSMFYIDNGCIDTVAPVGGVVGLLRHSFHGQFMVRQN